MASIVKRKSVYFIVFRHNKKQIWKKAGRLKVDAKRIKTEIERRAHLGRFGLAVDITFKELALRQTAVHQQKVRPGTWRSYSHYLDIRVLPYFGEYTAKSITPESIENFLSDCLKSGPAPQTVAQYFRLLKMILTTGVAWGYLHRNPSGLSL